MSVSLATLRRDLAKRMQFWGGDIQSGGSGTVTSATATTLVDTTRAEPDDEWDSAWIVLNPGSATNVIWRRVASDNGWVQATSTLTIDGTWPSPYTTGPPAGTPYELYKVFTPNVWADAINYALKKSYPHRHRAVDFEIPQNYYSRILDYGRLAKQLNTVTAPTTTLTVTEVADGAGAFQPGTYTLTYTYFNDFGETLAAPTSTVNIVGTNSRIDIAQLTSVPASVLGINYYCSLQPNDTTLDMLDMGAAAIQNFPTSLILPRAALYTPGMNLNGTVYEIIIGSPNPWFGVSPPSYNQTSVDFYRLHHILQRMNPGQQPEAWNDLGSDLWKPMGGTKIMLMYMPISQFNLRLICTTSVQTVSGETDTTQEPEELVLSGAEAYLWMLLTKTSTIVNVNWQKLHDQAWADFIKYCGEYAMETPRDVAHRPVIRTMY